MMHKHHLKSMSTPTTKLLLEGKEANMTPQELGH